MGKRQGSLITPPGLGCTLLGGVGGKIRVYIPFSTRPIEEPVVRVRVSISEYRPA